MTADAPRTVHELVAGAVGDVPGEIAVAAPGRRSTTYAELAEQVELVAGDLRAAAVEKGARVALVVENGPEAASAFLGISSASVCAPLNPAYRAEELEFYLGDLRATALVVSASLDTPARDVARALGVQIVELVVDADRPAGLFDLEGGGSDPSRAARIEPPGAMDEALVLHTSGTTARPKIVPLSHGQLLASAGNVARTLGLRPQDRCLGVMPLFHIHGLVAALLASLHARASVVCTPGFHQVRVFEWLRDGAPTWMTAVPTMYQALLERAQRDPSLVEGHGLRFVRSSSAAMPLAVLEGLERSLGVPVVEAYGMTEAAHQMASNPVSGTRKGGSVGVAAGPEVTVLDETGAAVASGDVGEVAIRGRTVFAGYESNPEANAAAFAGEWFRTGDLGRLDEDGYLFLVGRSKEIINRAGEKVSPAEIDDVLLRHPAVAQAVTFGMPHDRLGEEVAAAVVLRRDHVAGERDLQDFVAQTVAPYKVPRLVVVVDEIPKGATGKVQRASLPDRLRLSDPSVTHDEMGVSRFLEEELRAIMADVLELPEVGPTDDFFGLGGDSILGTEVITRTRELIGRPDLPLVAIVRAPTPRALAVEIEGQFGWDRDRLVRIVAGESDARPLYLIHGVDGDIVRFAALARLLGSSRSVYALRAPGHDAGEEPPSDVETLADAYLAEIRGVQATGPYVIGALCMGAAVALELAHRLAGAGERAALLLIDPRLRRPTTARYRRYLLLRRARQGRLAGAVLRRLARRSWTPDLGGARGDVWRALDAARDAYVPRPTTFPVALLRSENFEEQFDLPLWYLKSVFPRIVYEEAVPGDHSHLLALPAVYGVHPAVTRALARLEQELAS